MTEIISAVIGALIAGVAGAVAAVLSRRSEHARWLRNARQEAYVAFLSRVSGLGRESLEWKKLRRAGELLPFEAPFSYAVAFNEAERYADALKLMSPTEVSNAAVRLVIAAARATRVDDDLTEDRRAELRAELQAADRVFVRLAQGVLEI